MLSTGQSICDGEESENKVVCILIQTDITDTNK